MDAKRNLKLSRPSLQTSWFPFKRVKERELAFTSKLFLGQNSDRSVSINENHPETFMGRAHVSPMFSSLPYGEHCFPVSVFVLCK